MIEDSPPLGVDVNPNARPKFFPPEMGSGDSKLHFRKAVIQLTTKTQVSLRPGGGWSAAAEQVNAPSGSRWTQMWRLDLLQHI